MSHERTDVLIAAYVTLDPAGGDYQAVVDAGVKIEGAVRVSRDHAVETIPSGGAGLIVAYPRSSSAGVDNAVSRAVKKAVGEADGKKVKALRKAVAEAQQKMQAPAA
jgi:DUF917 family protein